MSCLEHFSPTLVTLVVKQQPRGLNKIQPFDHSYVYDAFVYFYKYSVYMEQTFSTSLSEYVMYFEYIVVCLTSFSWVVLQPSGPQFLSPTLLGL